MTTDPALIVLAFDTSGPHVSAAILAGDTVLSHRTEALARGQAERLFPLLEESLAEAGLSWDAIDLIGVGIGPGNFTGIRISVSAARGLSLSLERPAIGVSSLEAQAAGALRPCIASVAGRRGAVFAQLLGQDGDEPPRLMDHETLNAAGFAAALPAIGDGAEIVAGVTGGAILPSTPMAIGIAQVALSRRHQETSRPTPLYLRAADAAPARDRPPPRLE
ncbi:tRNA (adenosine(37)-N6)-threonylcarbamoyltransferase complex dimerization subunit type 1 TsaB [Rhodobacteraceae bacterium SC52]|nr:tRNA (adenosine(37)-N6)-threonylcarbamoyltransferase complex dimerization subunit type 1 TsaB [Rhodobacteraceae bacterium SC52]